ncbi:hypothetical protein [Massilia sp. erpn]|uniref:hypothetical protein n=1 Tax=Massilia sp. erpn TaxID=2738142 RepID=UPI002106ADFC|nr:hypothetical protein [Massilia sp. erpn]UTY55849.1 hypothetical protein HPQ68_00805 [Massilia sp. erpn]
MHENSDKAGLGSSSTDQENSFTVTLEQVNSAFGISADTLRALAASHGITPEALLVRAATAWAQADIPDFDLDTPELTPAQNEYLKQRENSRAATTTSQPPTLTDAFKRFSEGPGDNHENARPNPRNGGHN